MLKCSVVLGVYAGWGQKGGQLTLRRAAQSFYLSDGDSAHSLIKSSEDF